MNMTDKPKLKIINGGCADLEQPILKLLLQSFGSADKDRSELDRLTAILHQRANLSVGGGEQVKASGKNNEEQEDTI
ncbi:hypothetical protein GALL_26520 [mine drainage metagenome]|uniref:Uncharacterized protein n=1 Tax=mine drainage metagenome TaxID=410659 RepID=A0A1J5TKX3_9ZZZZ